MFSVSCKIVFFQTLPIANHLPPCLLFRPCPTLVHFPPALCWSAALMAVLVNVGLDQSSNLAIFVLAIYIFDLVKKLRRMPFMTRLFPFSWAWDQHHGYTGYGPPHWLGFFDANSEALFDPISIHSALLCDTLLWLLSLQHYCISNLLTANSFTSTQKQHCKNGYQRKQGF